MSHWIVVCALFVQARTGMLPDLESFLPKGWNDERSYRFLMFKSVYASVFYGVRNGLVWVGHQLW